jgi:radical SAM enzyme (TIGR01210 family)
VNAYPDTAAARDRFVLDRRGPRPRHDPGRLQGLIVEDERDTDGRPARTATVLLTGRECPWRCAMCDLWAYTIDEDTPRGAIPAQITAARQELASRHEAVAGIKLYNAGSFFDPRAVPESDYDDVAVALAGLSRVIVESHPTLVGPRVDRLIASLARYAAGGRERPALEVAMGLETAHPDALDKLNKRFTLRGFQNASDALRRRGVALRVFLLISPPFVPSNEQDEWLRRSIDAAFDCGATVVSLVPTRTGNGAMEALTDLAEFTSPAIDDIERSFALALRHAQGRGRVFVDLWDLDRFAGSTASLDSTRARLHAMNLEQRS